MKLLTAKKRKIAILFNGGLGDILLFVPLLKELKKHEFHITCIYYGKFKNDCLLDKSLFDEKKSRACFVLESLGLTQFDVISAASHDISEPASIGGTENAPDSKSSKSVSALDEFCINLNDFAKSNTKDPLIGRSDVIEKMIQTLGRRQKNNPLLIGDSGVGKTAIVEGLAEKIISGDVPDFLKTKTTWQK